MTVSPIPAHLKMKTSLEQSVFLIGLLLFLTSLFISLFKNVQMTFRPMRTGHCCDCWPIYHSHLQVKIRCLFVCIVVYVFS